MAKHDGYAKGEHRGGKVLAEYIYLDAEGENYHKIERTEHHQFPQFIWAPIGKDKDEMGWVPKQPKVKIPYMLPELIAAKPETPVYVCEGEKDAETLAEWDLVATTNPSGACKWTKDLDKWFKGKQLVYVMEDNDEPGRDHAKMVVRHLQRAGVPNVFVVRFDDLPETGDVTDWVEEHGGTKEKFLQRCASASKAKIKTEILINTGELDEAVRKLEQALIDSERPIVVRAGTLVQPIWQHWRAYRAKGKARKTQVTTLRPLSEANLSEMATKHCAIFYKYDGRAKKVVKCDPPNKVLEMLLDRGHWAFPTVSGCINAPTLRSDGSIMDKQGYDDDTGLWYYPNKDITLPAMPPKPTRDDAMEALQVLKKLFVEVPFTDPKLDLAVALAAVLTAVCRGAFDTAPMFMFTAPAMGTGKSYMVDIISHIVNGRWCPVVNLAGPKEEREKRIGSILLDGMPMVSLDNLEHDLNDVVLNQMLTQPVVGVRVLGKSGIVNCEWRGTVFATGNNVQIVGDLVRRGLTCNLNARMATPERRKFKYDPVNAILQDRGRYIAAALTVSRAYHLDKKVKKVAPLASFERWSHFVKDPLLWLGEADVLECQTIAKREDPFVKAAEEFVHLWSIGDVLKVGVPYRVTEIIKAVDDAMANNHLRDLLLSQAGSGRGNVQIDARRLGGWLRTLRNQTIVANGVEWVVGIGREDSIKGHGWMLSPKGQ